MSIWMLLNIVGAIVGLTGILFHLAQRILKPSSDRDILHYIAIRWAPLFLESRAVSLDNLRRIYAEEIKQSFGTGGSLQGWEAHQFLDKVATVLNKWYPTQQAWRQTVQQTKQSLPSANMPRDFYKDRYGLVLAMWSGVCMLGNFSMLLTRNYSALLTLVCTALTLLPSVAILIPFGFLKVRATMRVKTRLRNVEQDTFKFDSLLLEKSPGTLLYEKMMSLRQKRQDHGRDPDRTQLMEGEDAILQLWEYDRDDTPQG